VPHYQQISGPVCQSCNLQLKWRTTGNSEFFFPCVFHNSSAYDSHLIIKHLYKKQSKITVSLSDFKLTGYVIWTVTNFCRQVWTISLKIYTMMVLIVSNTCDARLVMVIPTFSRRESIHMSIWQLVMFSSINIGISFETQIGSNNRRWVQKSSRDMGYKQMQKYARFSQCLRQARCHFVGWLHGKFSPNGHLGIWNRPGTLLDVSRLYMAMLFKDDKLRIAADNKSEHLSYVRKCNKRWSVDS